MRTQIHGPFSVTGRDLLRTHPEPPPPEPPPEQDAEYTIPSNAVPLGVPRPDGGDTKNVPSLSLFTVTDIGTLDPQIAVSSSHVIVTTNTRISFHEKSGKRIQPTPPGILANPISPKSFFAPLAEDLAAHLNLPPGVDPVVFGLDAYYDTRVIFDPWRRRFWIGALAINNNTRAVKEGTDCNTCITCEAVADDPAERGARRTKFLVAVSSTEDPRDLWHFYWWDAVTDDGDCFDPAGCAGVSFVPGDAGDYPFLGIHPKWLVQTTAVGHRDVLYPTYPCGAKTSRAYSYVALVDADKLANGEPSEPIVIDDFTLPDGSRAKGPFAPAMHHSDPGDAVYLARPQDKDTIVVYKLSLGNEVVYQRADLAFNQFYNVIDPKQKAHLPEVQVAPPVYVDNNSVQRLSYRKNRLVFSFAECEKAADSQSCSGANALRVVSISLSPTIKLVFDQTICPRDSNDALQSCFRPAAEIAATGQIVVGYMRSSATIYPQGRYSLLSSTGGLEATGPVHGGSWPIYNPEKDATTPLGRLDNASISVDGGDPNGVWLLEPYAFRPDPSKPNGKYALAVSKVNTPLKPDWAILKETWLAKRFVHPGEPVQMQIVVANTGDGNAPPTRLVIHISKDYLISASDPVLAEVGVPRIRSGGRSSPLRVQARIPSKFAPGKYYVGARVISQSAEHNSANNSSRLVRNQPQLELR